MAMVFAAFVVAVATGSGFPENERWLGGFPRNASCDRGEFPRRSSGFFRCLALRSACSARTVVRLRAALPTSTVTTNWEIFRL